MKNDVANTAGRDLQALFEVGSLAGLSDGQLLDRFVARREEAVFEALVHRHGPMVWGVCRRVLRDHHDAEDAFQAYLPGARPEGGFGRAQGEARQLALRRGVPDGHEGECDEGEAAGAGRSGAGDARSRSGPT